MRQTYKDSTLKGMTKDELIHLLRLTEHSLEVAGEFYRNACDVNHKLANILDALHINWSKHDSTGKLDVISVEELMKKPWKPDFGEHYYSYDSIIGQAFGETWNDHDEDLLVWKAGNCFRTEEEAEAKGKEIMKAIKKEYEES